jgi:hypothetical protein
MDLLLRFRERALLFQGSTRDQWVLYDVYFIPKLRRNLVSLGQLTEIGHKIVVVMM